MTKTNKTHVDILIVDDREDNLLTMEAVLASPYYNLVKARSGEEALKYVLKQDFAVILLDVQMPGMNGFETAGLIKSRKKSRHIPIIFVTAISKASEHVRLGYAAGAIDYIFKPFQPDILRAKIENLVSIYHTHEQLKMQTRLLKENTSQLEQANTRLKHASEALERSEVLIRAFGDTSIDTIISFAEDGSLLTANPALFKMFGYTEEEIVREPVSSLLPDLSTSSLCHMHPYFGKIREVKAQRKNGTSFPVDIQINPANLQNDLIYVCSIRDITERKQLETKKKEQFDRLEELVHIRTSQLVKTNEDLLRSQDRFRKIFDSSPTMLAILSIESQICLDVNQAWLSSTGYTLAEVKQLLMPITMYSADIASHGNKQEAIDMLSLSNPVHNIRVTYVTKKGEKREGFLSTEIITIQDEPCILAVVTDTTEKLAMMKEMARLDQLNLIGEMAAGIAHEIRNPMTTVRGFLQISKTHLTSDYVDLMMSELDRANAIITEFLSLAKNKKTDPRLQDLNRIITTLYPLIHAEAVLTNKHVMLDLGNCPELYLDEKEIRQMILNLSLNGLEAMEKGTLTIKTFWEESDVVLMIRDQGCGIKDEYLDKIGTPFFTTKEKGTGLGLAVCYSIAARHQASIEIRSGEKGTAFLIRFNGSSEFK